MTEFKVGVAPELQKKGYRVRHVEFSTGLEANNAVFRARSMPMSCSTRCF